MNRGILTGVATVVALAGLTTGARAQDSDVAFGVKAGLNLASFNGSDTTFDTVSPKNRTGFAAGIFVVIPITPNFLIQPEALYSQKGGRYEEGGDELVLKFDYVEIPVLLKGRFGGGGVRPSVFAGPSVAFKTSAKTLLNGEEEDVEALKSTDFGIVFGAGLDFMTDSGVLTLDGRYTLGITNIPDDPDDPDFKNGVLSFSIGYAF